MRRFPDGTTFTASNETEGFICIEMKTGAPWTYQVLRCTGCQSQCLGFD